MTSISTYFLGHLLGPRSIVTGMNVLLITTDQQRADTLGVEGSPLGATPRLDGFAAQGTRFSAGAHAEPALPAGTATILTGTYPSTHGVTCNGIDLPPDAGERSVATLLGRAGYRTAMFGKAHFTTSFPFLPSGRIESVEGSAASPTTGTVRTSVSITRSSRSSGTTCASRISWAGGAGASARRRSVCTTALPVPRRPRAWIRADRVDAARGAGAQWDHRQTWPNRLPEEDHLTTWVADRACEWLRDVDGPFFGWVSFTDPHHPMDTPAPWCDRYTPEDVLEILPVVHPDELETKPPLHKLLAQGHAGEHWSGRTRAGRPSRARTWR